MNQLTLGSLFDGSGGFPLAGVINGITPVWASEIEPYPIRVTKARFPNMKHLGDVTKINGAEIEPVDIITFGSPCQDLSVAGKQLGIHEGQRSNLFFEAVRIIREMREHDRATGRADDDIRPRFAVWENVPGAFSSNKGKDFQAVLQALCEIKGTGVHVLEPKGKWNHAGCVVGDGYSIAWRVYDAQFWGVPQRRKRIYLIADFGGERAGEILFEREGVRGDSAEGGETREGIAQDAQGSAGRSDRVIGCDLYNGQLTGDKAATLGANSGASANHAGPSVCYAIEGNVVDREPKQNGKGWGANVCPALNTQDKHAICFQLCGDRDNPSITVGNMAYCIPANPMSDRGQSVCYAIDQQGGKGMAAYSEDTAPTLCSDSHGTPHAVCVQNDQGGSMMDVSDRAGTLRAQEHGHQPIVCMQNTGRGWWNQGEIAETLRTPCGGDSTKANLVVCIGNGQLNQISMAEQSNTLDCMHDQQAIVAPAKPPRKYIVRRLTPLECCRLQGFPDYWTDGVDGSDSAKYKMWGNGIALPCAADVLRRISGAMDEQREAVKWDA